MNYEKLKRAELDAIAEGIKSRQKKLYWDVYENIMPTKLLERTNVEDYLSQDVLDHLASNGLLLEQCQYTKTYEKCTIKTTRIRDSINITIDINEGNGVHVFVLSNFSNLRKSLELIYVDDYNIKDRLYINSENVAYVTTGKKFAIKELENAEEEENAK